jgi:hypothetical protein
MKRRKNFLKEASILLIAITMVLSTIIVTSGIVIFSQPPDYVDDLGYYSDVGHGPPYRAYDNFEGLTQDITDVHWWGVFDEGTYLPTLGDEFEIAFCADDGGIPDYNTHLYEFTGQIGAAISYTATGFIHMGTMEVYKLEMDLPTPVSMSSGWVSFFKITDNNQKFAIMVAPSGVGDGICYIKDGDPSVRPLDLAFELTTTESELNVYVDIKPGSCPNPINTNSKGVLPVAICGTPDFDVTDIKPETIRLGYFVTPIRWAYEDLATPFMGELCDCHELTGDGIMDLTLKFKIQDVVGSWDFFADGEITQVHITGELYDGTPFEGQDCVRIKHRYID